MDFNAEYYHQVAETAAPARVIAVTKYDKTKKLIRQCVAAGVNDVGENRILEAIAKQEELQTELSEQIDNLRWHLIGHMQTNKVAKTIDSNGQQRFHLIHSVDSVKLAEKISQVNNDHGLQQAVLLQVNISEEPQKYGFHKADLLSGFEQLKTLPGLNIQGLMCMAPHGASENQLHQVFGDLAALKTQLEADHHIPLPHLSMGMSDDYPIACQHGATLLRLGRILLKQDDSP